jgi:1-acyl-sn-glycerol-3-phosphate acyltransferase
VPVAIHGSSHVRNWKRLQFPKITTQYGTPFRFERVENPTREQSQAAADQIVSEIKALYASLEEVGRKGMVARVRELRRAERRGGRAATAQ